VPPPFSAIKVAGQPLSKLARRGREVEPPARQVTSYELELVDWRPPELNIRLSCSAGTYVRSLAHDLGQALGCGAHVVALRRTAIGVFRVGDAIPLAQLTPDSIASRLLPPESAVGHLPPLFLDAEESRRLTPGQPAESPAGAPDAPLSRAYDPAGRFLGIAANDGACWRARKILV
jgi:tRNA pseudouridine55 synthase